MSEINIARQHGLTPEAAKAAAEAVAGDLDEKFGLRWHWQTEDLLSFQSTGVKGSLRLTDGEAAVVIRLGFLLLPFKAVLEDEIHAFFDERFI